MAFRWIPEPECFNGDIGIIREINTFAEELTVEFDEGKDGGLQL